MNKEIEDLHSGKYEVHLTGKLITQLVKEKKWKDEKSLKEMRELGAKWNTKRNSLIFDF